MSAQTTNSFRTVMRGYDPAEVDKHVSQLSGVADDALARADDLEQRVAELESSLKAASQAKPAAPPPPVTPAEPTFHDFGKRVGRILALAEEEADEMRSSAAADVERMLGDAEEKTTALKVTTERYDRDTRAAADQEAARIVEDAKRTADQVTDDAERAAMTRRGEAEALHEEQRAIAAKAAADFESTLAERRDTAERLFQDRADEEERNLDEARDRVARVRAEAEQTGADANRRATQLTAESEQKAKQIVAEAVARADRIREESERELATAVQRRNSINAQLANVRQMLATLSGTAPQTDQPE